MLMTWFLCWDVVNFPLHDFDVKIFMHDYLVVNCRRDDYFLCIYLNCMIYCLIRNRALQSMRLEGSLMHSWRNNSNIMYPVPSQQQIVIGFRSNHQEKCWSFHSPHHQVNLDSSKRTSRFSFIVGKYDIVWLQIRLYQTNLFQEILWQ